MTDVLILMLGWIVCVCVCCFANVNKEKTSI